MKRCDLRPLDLFTMGELVDEVMERCSGAVLVMLNYPHPENEEPALSIHVVGDSADELMKSMGLLETGRIVLRERIQDALEG